MARSTRRQFVQQVAGLGVGIGIGGGLIFGDACRSGDSKPTEPAPTPAKAVLPTAGKTFSAAELATVSAVCDRILPRDQDPGAIDLGVPAYIDRMLAEPEFSEHRELVGRLLPMLDRQAQQRFAGKPFHEAAPDQQDSLLAAWQHGGGGDRRFFEVLLGLTLEGAFGDPKYGGNAGGRGFALIGFAPGPPTSRPIYDHAPAVGSPRRVPG